MKKMISIFLAICFCFLLISCTNPGPTITEENIEWSCCKSPTTGKCYEITTSTISFTIFCYGFMGMSEIPCEDMPEN